MIQQQVQLDGSFGTPELRPVIKGGAQIDDGRVQTEQFVLEARLAPPAMRQFLTAGQQFQKHRLIQLPGAMLIGVGQGRARGSSRHSQMLQLPSGGCQSLANFAQAVGATQLTEQHGHELAPTSKTASVTLSLMLVDGRFKLGARKQLPQLTENAAYSIHG